MFFHIGSIKKISTVYKGHWVKRGCEFVPVLSLIPSVESIIMCHVSGSLKVFFDFGGIIYSYYWIISFVCYEYFQ